MIWRALFVGGLLVLGCAGLPAAQPVPTDQAAPVAHATAIPTPSAAPTEPAGPTLTPAPPTAAPTPAPPPSPAPTPSAAPTPVALDPVPAAGKFQMDLYRRGAHVRQVTNAMCVPASMQIMINLMSDGEPDRSKETQKELYALARSYSPWITPDRRGAAANGWAAGLEDLGYGDFEPQGLPTLDEALRTAARQMRFLDKPVGLIVWSGDHAWVMSGFKATADPAWTDDFEVTAVWIEDPWSGRTDRTWGTGLAPHTLVSKDDLGEDFLAWPSRWFARLTGASSYRWVIVAPLN